MIPNPWIIDLPNLSLEATGDVARFANEVV